MKKLSKSQRKRLLKRGGRRVEDLASGKVKGISEAQFRRTIRKRRR